MKIQLCAIKCEIFMNFFKNTPTNGLKLSNNSEGYKKFAKHPNKMA